jgi:hypothetical protein
MALRSLQEEDRYMSWFVIAAIAFGAFWLGWFICALLTAGRCSDCLLAARRFMGGEGGVQPRG